MKLVAAYLLAVLGGNSSPSEADVKKILSSVGADADAAQLKTLVSELKGKDLAELHCCCCCFFSLGGGWVRQRGLPGVGGVRIVLVFFLGVQTLHPFLLVPEADLVLAQMGLGNVQEFFHFCLLDAKPRGQQLLVGHPRRFEHIQLVPQIAGWKKMREALYEFGTVFQHRAQAIVGFYAFVIAIAEVWIVILIVIL